MSLGKSFSCSKRLNYVVWPLWGVNILNTITVIYFLSSSNGKIENLILSRSPLAAWICALPGSAQSHSSVENTVLAFKISANKAAAKNSSVGIPSGPDETNSSRLCCCQSFLIQVWALAVCNFLFLNLKAAFAPFPWDVSANVPDPSDCSVGPSTRAPLGFRALA